jgi:hypothetical protein
VAPHTNGTGPPGGPNEDQVGRLVQQLKFNDGTASSDAALWVDAKTFLPVRMILGPQDGSTDFDWLDPTEASQDSGGTPCAPAL